MNEEEESYEESYCVMDGRAWCDEGIDDALVISLCDTLQEAISDAEEYGGAIFKLDNKGEYSIRIQAPEKKHHKHRRRK